MRVAAPTYTTERELRDAVLEHCRKEHLRIFGKAYRGRDVQESQTFWAKYLEDQLEAMRLADALTSTFAEIEAFVTRDPKPHFTIAIRLQGARGLIRGEARSVIKRLEQFAQEPRATSPRTLYLRGMELQRVNQAVPVDKRRTRDVPEPWTHHAYRQMSNGELAILSLLGGFFPEVHVDKKHPMSVVEVIRRETRTVRECRMRAKIAP